MSEPTPAAVSPKVQRGVITAAGRRMTGRAEPPVIRTVVPETEPAPRTTYGYVTNVARYLQIAIPRPAPDDTRNDAVLARAALAYCPDGIVQFTDWALETPYQSVATWLDRGITSGLLAGVARDSARMRVACPICGHTELNTPAGIEALMLHTLMQHEGHDEGVLTPVPPVIGSDNEENHP